MALPAKRKTETGAPPRAKSKTGAVKADSGKGPAKKKLNKPIAGLTKPQMTGTEEPEELKAQPKPKSKKTSKGGGGTGLY